MSRDFIAHTARLPRRPQAAARGALRPETAVGEAARFFPPTAQPKAAEARAGEIGGPEGPEPTRYGDWERKGICVDF